MVGVIIMFISALLIYARINDWMRYKDICEKKNDWSGFKKKMKRHQRLLVIYAIAFVVGLFEMFWG